MSLLFAFWALDAHGQPDPKSADAWGERCPFDALDAYDRATVGPFLTVVEDTTECVTFAGDITEALRGFVAETATRSRWTPDSNLDAIAQTLDACHVLADHATDEAAREAVYEWREPDPDTWRRGPLPDRVRRAIRHGAEAVGREAAGLALRDHLLAIASPTRLAA